ncbi:MAG: hypothetical protein Q8L46_00460, partial [candidate division WWE3 bacterium]|nr:hypothetical protein [candidate division WWE3 bacterium]
MRTLAFLQEIGFRDASSFGEEAAALGDLVKVGVPVATAFALPTSSYAEFISSKLARQLLLSSSGQSVQDLRRQLGGLAFPARLRREVGEFYRRLSGPRDTFVSVRAGHQQLRTAGVEELLLAIKKIWIEHLVGVAAREGDFYQEALAILVQQETMADFRGFLSTSSTQLPSADLCLVEVEYFQGKERFVLEKSNGRIVRRDVSGMADSTVDQRSVVELSSWASKIEPVLGAAYRLGWRVWRGQIVFGEIEPVFLPRARAFALPLWLEVTRKWEEGVPHPAGLVSSDSGVAVDLAQRFPQWSVLLFLEPFNFGQLDAFREGKRKVGLKNLHLILPPVRTVDGMRELKRYLSGEKVQRGPNLKFFFQAAYPSNVVLMEQFLQIGVDGVILNEPELAKSMLGTTERVEPDESLAWAIKESQRQCQLESVPLLYRTNQIRDWVLMELAKVGVGGIVVPASQHPDFSKLLQQVEERRL